MKIYTLLALILLSLLTTAFYAQTPSPIPEEARKHFVVGTTLFKDAKTTDDYAQVVNEFKQAAELGPQWPEARYNLGLAREAAGDYSGSIEDLEVYQKFKLTEADARTIQDKIYVLEAKESERENMLGFFQAKPGAPSYAWTFKTSSKISWANGLSGTARVGAAGDSITVIISVPTPQGPSLLELDGKVKGTDFNSIEWKADGKGSRVVIKATIDRAASQILFENVFCMGNYSYDAAYITFDLKK